MKNISKEAEDGIAQLQVIEQNLSNFMMQKQSLQSQLLETENALKELESAKEKVYKIIGTIMIASKKEDLKKDLASKKESLELRLKTIDKQEERLKKNAEDIQKLVMKEIKNDQ